MQRICDEQERRVYHGTKQSAEVKAAEQWHLMQGSSQAS
jgi:hypothetical protein